MPNRGEPKHYKNSRKIAPVETEVLVVAPDMAQAYCQSIGNPPMREDVLNWMRDAARLPRLAASLMCHVRPESECWPDFGLIGDTDLAERTPREVASLGEAAILQYAAYVSTAFFKHPVALDAERVLDILTDADLVSPDTSPFDLAASVPFSSEREAGLVVSSVASFFRSVEAGSDVSDEARETMCGLSWAVSDWSLRKTYGHWSSDWKSRRAALGLSYRKVAAEAGVSAPTYLYAEKGDMAVRPGTAKAIEGALSRLEGT